MKTISLLSIMIIALSAFILAGPGTVHGQGDSAISATVVGEGTFITVKESVAGDVVSLYRVSGDRIVLVDTVVNTSARSDRDVKLSTRYLHRINVENR